MPLQPPKIVRESQPSFAGMGVGAEERMLTIRKNGTLYD